MRRNLKVIEEDFEGSALEAKGILAKAKAASRELYPDEVTRFDELTKNIIPRIKQERAEAQNYERQIIGFSQGQGQPNMHPSSIVYGQMNSGAPDRVLPINGVLPGETEYRYDPIVRQKKLRAFRNERVAYDCGHYIRAIVARESNTIDQPAEDLCRRCGLVVENTAYEYSGPQGGYLVSAPLSQTIIDVRENTGVSRKICDIQPMTADTLTIPKRSAGLTIYAPGESNAITTSDKTWKQVELINKKRAVASYISQELVDDALISIVDNVISEMGYSLALQEDNELVNGTGAGATYFGVTGLLSSIGSAGISTAATGHDTWPELDIADCAAAVGLLPERFQVNPCWVCSAAFYNAVFMRIAFQAGGVRANEVMSSTPMTRSFLGYPVYITSQMPTATAAATVCALFGDFTMGVVLGDRMGVRIGRDDSTQFLSDLTTLKATVRYDIKVHQPGTSAAAGAYVALKTAS